MNFYGNYILHEERLRDLEQQAKHKAHRRHVHHKVLHTVGHIFVRVGKNLQDIAES